MDRRLGFLVLMAAGLLVLGLAPPTRAEEDQVLDQDDGLDVEDELDLGLVDEEEGGDAPEEEAAKAPPAPKVGGMSSEWAGLVVKTCLGVC